jgi:two-component system chemotaxis response regulator CheY
MAYNILIVDDSITTRAVISKTINIAGVETNEIFEANNGKEALDILNENWIDIIFSDINMPVMGGVELIERMYNDGVLKTIPVIIVSTEGNATRIEQLKSRGVKAYIRKPFTPELIKGVVDDILEDDNEQ